MLGILLFTACLGEPKPEDVPSDTDADTASTGDSDHTVPEETGSPSEDSDPGDSASPPDSEEPPVDTGDADGDGYTSTEDCDDADASVYPGAPEVCDDAVFNDCTGEPNAALEACGLTPWEDMSGVQRLVGTNDKDYAGAFLGSLGDTNGDGQPDVLVGGPQSGPGGAGRNWVIGADLWSATTLDDAALATIVGSNYQHMGEAVAGVGDMDGDGYGDLAVGSSATGNQYVYTGPVTGALGLDDAQLTLFGPTCGVCSLGYEVAGPGDLNGDGRDDLMAGGSTSGEAGSAVASVAIFQATYGDLIEADDADVLINGTTLDAGWGLRLVGPGDLDGDGVPDLAIANATSSDYTTEGGVVFLFSGEVSGSVSFDDADGVLYPTAEEEQAGAALAPAGDADGDGLQDIVVGGSATSPEGFAGTTWVVLGGSSGMVDLADSWGAVLGDNTGDEAGGAVSADDYNQDGQIDLAIGQWDSTQGGVTSGALYLVLGPLSGTSVIQTCARRWAGDRASRLGVATAAPGDLDADGWPDLVVGANAYSTSVLVGPGAIYLWSGASL